ncbi:MAG: radical SAM protein [Oscillospiraceae bacterium]
MERSSFMLGVAVGCAYNQCKFCNLFKHLQHRLPPLEQVEAELKRVQRLGGNPQQVFLGDGNAFGMPTDRLLNILQMVAHYFPACQAVNMDATVTDIRRKTDAELRQLYDAGVRNLYLGIECGLDDVLAFMHKDHNLQQAYTAIARIQAAGLIFNAHIMTGIAGAGRGVENAEALAEFFNHTRPLRVTNFSLFLSRSVSLYEEIEAGRFTPADEAENLVEERRLLELLKTDGLIYDGMHDWIEVRVRGVLPRDRDAMLQKLDEAIAQHSQLAPVVALCR